MSLLMQKLGHRAIRSVIDVLGWLIPDSSSKVKEKKRKLEAGGKFDECIQDVREAIETLLGSEECVAARCWLFS
jgi:hypothetical protein